MQNSEKHGKLSDQTWSWWKVFVYACLCSHCCQAANLNISHRAANLNIEKFN